MLTRHVVRLVHGVIRDAFLGEDCKDTLSAGGTWDADDMNCHFDEVDILELDISEGIYLKTKLLLKGKA